MLYLNVTILKRHNINRGEHLLDVHFMLVGKVKIVQLKNETRLSLQPNRNPVFNFPKIDSFHFYGIFNFKMYRNRFSLFAKRLKKKEINNSIESNVLIGKPRTTNTNVNFQKKKKVNFKAKQKRKIMI